MIELQRAGLIQPEAPAKVSKLRMDYCALGKEYSQQLESGAIATRADLARSLGVSRAWISKVLNRYK